MRKINLMHDWPWLHATDATWTATTTNQAVYTAASDLASNWRKTLYIICNDEPLSLLQKQEIIEYATQTGQPRFYAAEGSEIILAPKPDAVYTISHEYIHVPALVTSGSSHHVIYDWAIDLLVYQTAVLAARRLRDSELRAEMESELSQVLTFARDEVRRTRQLPRPKHRKDVGWP
tara:strand:+ start:832 stop:1359 length:528 start_codon:yes stop_codon:yes gene_type:complete